ncbi:MAG: hypothetical protein DRZ82_00035 [Thermoprotei archaeon]|nr:MAG: hypothetical protein DRZ82_00035 [Thermoprotei archaeon]
MYHRSFKLRYSIIVFLLILIAPTLSCISVHSSSEEGVKVISSLGSRKVIIINPSPFNVTKMAIVNLTFMPREAYNNTICVYDEEGNPVPFQILNANYFPETHYYKSCNIGILVTLPKWGYRKYVITFSSEPITITPMSTDLRVVILNTTTGLVVENSYYRAEFRNDVPYGIYRLYIKGFSQSIVMENWLLMGFSIMLSNGSIISPMDFKYVNLTIASLGNVSTTVSIIGHSDILEYTCTYIFRASSPWIDMTLTLRPLKEGVIKNVFAPLARVPIDVFDEYVLSYNVSGPLEFSEIYPSKSYRPAPVWFMLISRKEGFGALFSYRFNEINMTELNEAIFNNINFSAMSESEKILLNSTFTNMSLLLNAERLLGEGILSVNDVIQMLKSLENNTQRYVTYLTKVPYTFSTLNVSFAKRLSIIAMPTCYNLGLHLNETLYDRPISVTCSLLVLGHIPSLQNSTYYAGWLSYIEHYIPLIKASLPIVASMIVPSKVQVDEFFKVNSTLRFLEDLHSVNITFEYPNELKLLEGNKTYHFTDVKSGEALNLTWYFVGLFEGNHTLSMTICSEKGNLTLTSIIAVLLPPVIPTRTHSLTVKCFDAEGKPMPNHVVLVYDKREGKLVAWNVTDVNGTAIFENLSEGHYEIKVSDGRILNSTSIYLYKDMEVQMRVYKYSITVNVFLENGLPMKNTAVYIYDVNGSLVFLGYTNENGTLTKRGLLPGNYTIEVKMGDLSVDSKDVNIVKQSTVDFVIKIYQVNVQALSPEGRPLPGALITIRSAKGEVVATYVADSFGFASFTLPKGAYTIIAEKVGYRGEKRVEISNNMTIYVVCHAPERTWILMVIAPLLLILSFILRYKRLQAMYSVENKYRQLLRRLEELYRKGLVEEKFYIKLKSEYEEKLRELEGGRP